MDDAQESMQAGVHIPIIQEPWNKTEENSKDREAVEKAKEVESQTEENLKSPTEKETTNPGIETIREDRTDQKALKDPGIHQGGLKEVRGKGNLRERNTIMTAVEIPRNPQADLDLANHHLENPTGHHVEIT